MSEINLSGSEITVLKTMGLNGSQVMGEVLLSRVQGLEEAELLDVLQGLMAVGYVLGSKDNIRKVDEMLNVTFRVNSAYMKMLHSALDPRARQMQNKPRRRRRE